MKRILFSGLLLCLSVSLFAQNSNEISAASSIRKWADGPLTLEDFSYRTGGNSDKAMRLSYGIRWKDDKHKIGNTTFVYPTFYTYMNPYASWLKPEYRTPEYLRYAQTYFDYVELCKRRAQKEASQRNEHSIDYIVRFHMDVADGFFEELDGETHDGADTAAVRICHERVAAELAEENDFEYVPDYKIDPKGRAMGMHIGLGSEFHVGNMGAYVPSLIGLEFGFDFNFNRWTIFWDGLIGSGGNLRQDIYRYSLPWEAGNHMSGGNINLSVGYAAWDSQWWKITPLAGIGVDYIDYPEKYSRDDKTEIAAFRVLCGLNADFKFSRQIHGEGMAESSVRARLYGAYNNYPVPIGSSWSINFSLGVNWLAWYLK